MRLLCGVGLFPWLFHYLNIDNSPDECHKYIPVCIFCNGVMYHIFLPESHFMKAFDISANVYFILKINNETKNQPETCFITVFCGLVFFLNHFYLGNSDLIHVVFIQWLFLYLYIKSEMYDNSDKLL